jgi:hypothetical protein
MSNYSMIILKPILKTYTRNNTYHLMVCMIYLLSVGLKRGLLIVKFSKLINITGYCNALGNKGRDN